MTVLDNYLQSTLKQLNYYKSVGEKTFNQLLAPQLFIQINEESNSIAIIVQHLCGNMFSRFTDFLTTDGEKEWRNRDIEFEPVLNNYETLIEQWNNAWACCLNTVAALTPQDLQKEITIRGEKHSVLEAINRQLAHYPYHIGQIVFIGKYLSNKNWQSLTIPKGNSQVYNEEKFNEAKK